MLKSRELYLSKAEQDKILFLKDADYNSAKIAWKIGRSKAVVNRFLIKPDSYGTNSKQENNNSFKARETSTEVSSI